jgi:hypothetical protein
MKLVEGIVCILIFTLLSLRLPGVTEKTMNASVCLSVLRTGIAARAFQVMRQKLKSLGRFCMCVCVNLFT